jgi:catechol 2,3-dioxygenase-like lactoylglutathione lyase family enzyme
MKLNAVHTTLPVADLDRAKKFYREKLGLSPSTEEPGGVFYEVGPTRFLVFPAGGRASGEHTQMGFTVDDIESAVAELKSRAVVFEEYDFPGLKTVGSVATTGPIRAAWFKDSEGNLLGLVQFVAS